MIEINNFTAGRIDKSFLKKVAQKVLEKEKKKNFDLSIALVGPSKIKELNKRYLKKNKITGALSFLYNERSSVYFSSKENYNERSPVYFSPKENYNGNGEIIICSKEVKKNAKRLKTIFKKELAEVLIHGILHILGYDHEAPKKKEREMLKKQAHYLKLFFKE